MATIGVMLVLAAGITTLFHRDGNGGVALRAAQRELVSALERARTTARARQTPVRWCVLAQPVPGGIASGTGRRWWLLRADGATWLPLRDTGELPAGTCVVPSDRSTLQLRDSTAWRDGLLTQFDGSASVEEGAVNYLEFRPDGSVSGGPRQIVLARADEAPGMAPRLVDPAAVRFVLVAADGHSEEGMP